MRIQQSLQCWAVIALASSVLCSAWVGTTSMSRHYQPNYTSLSSQTNDNVAKHAMDSRREFVHSMAAIIPLLSFPNVARAAAQRAVGGAEVACREAGNCLETGQLDGAVGWNWGGKDRCDAADPRCGPDGKLGEMPLGKDVPVITNRITHVVKLTLDVGRDESSTLLLGLYGEDCPGSVKEMLQFLTNGLVTTSQLALQDGMGITTAPVALLEGGKIPAIVPGKILDFGIPSQSAAYARSRGRRNAGDNFVAQPRPPVAIVEKDAFVRKHDVAGLISMSSKGLGYGGFESDDEAFERAFQIIADAVPALDKQGQRRVIGQVLDAPSMAFLSRLASLPTKKGIKGVVPGLNAGPPLLKVTVRDIEVEQPSTGM